MNIPKDLRYSKDHEWVRVTGSRGIVGITEYAVVQLGDITLVEAPQIGAQVRTGDAVGVIESVKAVSDLFSPCSGKVISVNGNLEDAPETVNEDPYKEGWIFEIEFADATDIDKLFDATGYKTHIDELEE